MRILNGTTLFFLITFLSYPAVASAGSKDSLVGNSNKTVKELATERTVNVIEELEKRLKLKSYSLKIDKLVEVAPGYEKEYSGLDYLFEDFWTYYLKKQQERELSQEEESVATEDSTEAPVKGEIIIFDESDR